MKTNFFGNLAVGVACAGVAFSLSSAAAQDASTAATASAAAPATAEAPATPQLAYGASQILQLAQAKVGDDTIIAYIHNSGNSYALSAEQIIYLQQQGLSTSVLNAMLSQPKTGGLAYLPPAAAAPPTESPAIDAQAAYDAQPAASTATVGPAITAIDPSAAAAAAVSYYPTYYCPPYAYPYYYPAYGYYGFYPGVSVSIGWGRGWRGGGFHGGGFHGGGFHGGFHH